MQSPGETASADASYPKNKHHDAATALGEILRGNREYGMGGTYAVCSAHPAVLNAAIHQSIAGDSLLHVESTSSQVNQFGGYSGFTPKQFAESLRAAAVRAGLEEQRILIGGDHLGPFPWRHEPCSAALGKACDLVQSCVIAGYQKIHLDASMACSDDSPSSLAESVVAERTAILCRAAEEAFRQLPSGSAPPVYVVGTEVPAPGGESNHSGAPKVTTAEHVHRSLETFRTAFAEEKLTSAWQRVVAIVVQPGVDFGSDAIFDYDPTGTHALSESLENHSGIVFEAHSTDYQSPRALAQLVRNHFAILKVGPWLTFAYREAILSLSAIERELYSAGARQVSCVRDALEAVMLHQPGYWKSYYGGGEEDIRRSLIYGLSDRCRYYWNQPTVRREIERLFENLESRTIPLPLISQYLPTEYDAIRAGELGSVPQQMIEHRIRRVLRIYADACEGSPTTP